MSNYTKVHIEPFFVNNDAAVLIPGLTDADFIKGLRRDGVVVNDEVITVQERADIEPGYYDATYIAKAVGFDEVKIAHPLYGVVMIWTNQIMSVIDSSTSQVIGNVSGDGEYGGPYPDGITIIDPTINRMHDNEDLFNP